MPEAEPKHRVLVVEDDSAMRKLMVKVLDRTGRYEVSQAFDGQEAVERIDAGPVFDVVLSDIQMPRLGGEEVLAHVRKCSPNTSVVMITAYRNDESVVRCLANGAMDYLTKPVRVSNLLQTIDRAVERRQQMPTGEGDLAVRQEVRDWVEITAPSHFEFVERFQKFVARLYDTQMTEEEKNDIRVAIDEIGQNAVEWGNRDDASKRIRLSYCLFTDKIVFKIEDEGEGFDTQHLKDPSRDPLAHIMERLASGKRMGGYGIFMTKSIMDDIVFSERGNVVVLSKYIGLPPADEADASNPPPPSPSPEKTAPPEPPAAGETRDGDG